MARIPARHENESHDENYDGATPPSFTPARVRTPRTAQNQDASHKSHSSKTSTPPSFAPQPKKRTSQSHSTVHTDMPQSFRNTSGAASAMSSSQQSNAQYPSYSAGPSAPQAPAANQLGSSTRKKSKHIFTKFVAVLLVLILGAGTWAWFWVDSQLNRTFDLTSTGDNSSANTWLILGSDARDGVIGSEEAATVTGFRTDTILVLSKPKSGPSSLISIPRDSYVVVNDEGMKINAVAQEAGYDALIGAVEGITSTKIDHVVQVGFDGVADIVNAMGGVDLCYDYDVNDAYSGMNWTAGCHTTDGAGALAFSRMRYSDPEGDIGRAKRQRMVISAIMKKAASPAILSNPSTAMNVASHTFAALKEDKKTNPASMLAMALAFRDATGSHGVTGSVYFDDLNYTPGNIGSAVHLDEEKNNELFANLNRGAISAGTTVGGYTGE